MELFTIYRSPTQQQSSIYHPSTNIARCTLNPLSLLLIRGSRTKNKMCPRSAMCGFDNVKWGVKYKVTIRWYVGNRLWDYLLYTAIPPNNNPRSIYISLPLSVYLSTTHRATLKRCTLDPPSLEKVLMHKKKGPPVCVHGSNNVKRRFICNVSIVLIFFIIPVGLKIGFCVKSTKEGIVTLRIGL